MLVLSAGRERPDLPGLKRLVADAALALQLRSRDEFLDAFGAQRVAEMRVAELGGADALLLFLDAAAHFQRQPHGPFQVFVADFGILAGEISFNRPLIVLLTPLMSRPDSAPPKNTRFCRRPGGSGCAVV
jgi:hypothetical protein